MANKVMAIVMLIIAVILNFPLALSIIIGNLAICLAILAARNGRDGMGKEGMKGLDDESRVRSLTDMSVVFVSAEVLLVVLLFRFFSALT